MSVKENKPFTCPVCHGSGISPIFSNTGTDASAKPCISCQGKGIVWGPPEEEIGEDVDIVEYPTSGGIVKVKRKKVLLQG